MHKTMLPRMMILLLGLLTVAAFFMPFAPIGTAAGDGRCLSMHEMVSLLCKTGTLPADAAAMQIKGCLLAGVGVFGACIVLWACLKNATMVILNALLVAGCFSAVVTELVQSQPAGEFGTAYYLCIPIAIAIVLCGVWLFLVKRKEKRMLRAAAV